MLKQR